MHPSLSAPSAPAPHRSPDALRASPDWRGRYGPHALVTGASDGIGRAFA